MPSKILDAVYEELRESDVLTAKQIAMRRGFSPKAVADAINHRVTPKMQKIYSRPSLDAGGYENAVKEYSLTPFRATRRDKSLPMPYVPPFREMTQKDHDIWSHRNLAMLAR